MVMLLLYLADQIRCKLILTSDWPMFMKKFKQWTHELVELWNIRHDRD
jgi:hypothetical protein